MKIFGAYVHARPDGRIFYVGKGTETRAHNLTRNLHHGNVVKKHGAESILVGFMPCSSEAIALELEIGLIKCLRRSGVVLTNQTDGGEGCTGLIHTAEAKAKVSRANKGRKATTEHRAKIKAAINKAWTSPELRAKVAANSAKCWASEEYRTKHALSMKSAMATPEYKDAMRIASAGRTHSAETKAKIGAANKSRWTPERRAKRSADNKERWKDAAYREKIIAVNTGTKHSDETRAKISLAAKQRKQRKPNE